MSTGPGRPRLLCLFPTAWDRRQLAAAPALADRWAIEMVGPPDEQCRWDFDICRFVDEVAATARRERVAGVFSSSDYPGCIAAAAVARAAGLPGPDPAAVLAAAHKWESRLVQRRVAPEATPAFALVDPFARLPEPFPVPLPCFAKPVKSSFSVFARRIEDWAALEAFCRHGPLRDFVVYFAHQFNELARRYAAFTHDASRLLVEGLVTGAQFTVEGFTAAGTPTVLGVVDSVLHPGTRSFARFDYPSGLPDGVQARAGDLAGRVVRGLGLDQTLWNLEMFWDEATDRLAIIEVNPRMCAQFADLYAKVDGVNGYAIACALATGVPPRLVRGAGRHRVAASVPLRVFAPTRLTRVPDAADVAAVAALAPDTLVWVDAPAGTDLTDFESSEDGQSIRYAVVNLGAADRGALLKASAAIQKRLGFIFEPAAAATSANAAPPPR